MNPIGEVGRLAVLGNPYAAIAPAAEGKKVKRSAGQRLMSGGPVTRILTVAACTALSLCSGCTIMFMNGNGPRDYHATKLAKIPYLRDRYSILDRKEVRDLPRGKSTLLDFWGGSPKRVARNDHGELVILVPRFEYDLYLTPSGPGFGPGPLGGVIYREDGMPISGYSVSPAPLFLFYLRFAYAHSEENFPLVSLRHWPWSGSLYNGDLWRAREAKYNDKDAWFTLLGLFGKGEVNGKKYLQVLWIPIPIGDSKRSTDEE